MADEPDDTTAPAPPRSAAAAARRARRIGGRPGARPPGPSHALDEAAEAPAEGQQRPVGRHTAGADAASSAPKASAKVAGTKAASGRAGASPKPTRTSLAKSSTAKASAKDDDESDGPDVITQVPGWLLWAPAAALGVVAIVFAIAVAVTAHGVWYATPSASSVRDEVLAAAKTCVAATNSYKYSTIAADERNGLKCTTGDWTANYRKAMEQVLGPSSKTLKSAQSTQINAAGVQSVTSNGTVWTLLVFGQASVTSVNQRTPRTDPFSAVVTMRKDDGAWKIADIDQVLKPIKSS